MESEEVTSLHCKSNRYILQAYARFPEIVQNFSERKILLSLCSIIFFAFALRLPIQTSLSVAPKLQVSLCSGGNCQKIRKTSTSQWWGQAGADQTLQWRTDWQIFRHFCWKSEVGCHRHIRKGMETFTCISMSLL